MNSKILLITDLVKLAGLIAKTNDKLFELKTTGMTWLSNRKGVKSLLTGNLKPFWMPKPKETPPVH